MKKLLFKFFNANYLFVFVGLISFIRFYQFRFGSDSASYHFAYPLQIIKNKEFFDQMNNLLWKFPHLADSINLFIKDIHLIHLFWTLVPILNFFLIRFLVKKIFYFSKIESIYIYKDNKYDITQYVALIIVLSGSYFYTIGSGHSEQLNILILISSIISGLSK